jgi:hypothetical protein
MQEAGVVVMQVTYAGNTTIPHGTVGGNPQGSLTLASGEQLVSMFGTSSNYVNSVGFNTNGGLRHGPWGNYSQGTPYKFIGALTGFFGGIITQELVALGAWASDGSVLTPLRPPPPSLPSLDGNGFDVDEPCPETQLFGSGIDYHLMENQVRQTEEIVNIIFITFRT